MRVNSIVGQFASEVSCSGVDFLVITITYEKKSNVSH